MPEKIWNQCLESLKSEIPQAQFNTFFASLQADIEGKTLVLYTPNEIFQEQIRLNYTKQIKSAIKRSVTDSVENFKIVVGQKNSITDSSTYSVNNSVSETKSSDNIGEFENYRCNLNPLYTFDHFVEGESNQIARAASIAVASKPGTSFNPLFIYGNSGLGKTHLMHAIGHEIKKNQPEAKIVFISSEKFVKDMVLSIKNNAMNDFKNFYRGVDALLIDDVQFIGGKERSQEEFFHTFNTLIEESRQLIMTCDTFPKGLQNMEERLRSRLGWGLTVSIDPPDLETRVAILKSKAIESNFDLPDEVAFFIAKNVRSNIRDLESALSRVIFNTTFMRGSKITLTNAQDALRDQLLIQAKQVTIDNIQKTVSEYFKIRISDLLSKKRNRSITRPRQIAMAIARELTNHSLPEIGNAFGGRDHSTVINACKQVEKLRKSEPLIEEDYNNLFRTISS